MGFRMRRSRSQARPMAAERRGAPGPRARMWLGWAAGILGVGLVVFLIGRAGSEAELSSPTPLPSAAGPLTITFGTALDAVSGEAVDPTDRFRASDPIAYSVRLAAAPGVATILVEIVRLEGEQETVVQEPSTQGIDATSRVIAFTFAVPTSEVIVAWGPGDYEMRMYLRAGADPIAAGRFTLVETPLAS